MGTDLQLKLAILYRMSRAQPCTNIGHTHIACVSSIAWRGLNVKDRIEEGIDRIVEGNDGTAHRV